MAVAKKPAVAKPKAKAAPKAAQSKPKGDGLSINTSVDRGAREKVAEALTKAVADSYTLYVKTLGVHWNVQGANFYGLHKLTDEQYNELHQAADEIAERIRALGKLVPTGGETFRSLTVIDNEAPHGTTPQMIKQLVLDNETAARRMSEFAELAEEAGDLFSHDMLVARIGVHEQNAWMLRSSLGE
ncbi:MULTISPECIES: Dps family protein [unclassified Pseudomonas]|uniref:Dps family protein n=1 Tax=unclassified Pseudomonas TaxID=196821 RepID=UPI0004823199|nr:MULTISPECIES: DNA starvation/stationary phase protection protein [unclassified Pseudomonas]MBD9396072.1 DNA starvation/stationary phase protection protein [Pseudomonas sp. PDM11]MBV7561757.1 DNA starvation/stationary phase protection protein [Pseudomonas sp. sia0905]PZW67664.1 starvation-inducible DNA-binding protein [Pseudomonas sp. URMO17WK12:I1]